MLAALELQAIYRSDVESFKIITVFLLLFATNRVTGIILLGTFVNVDVAAKAGATAKEAEAAFAPNDAGSLPFIPARLPDSNANAEVFRSVPALAVKLVLVNVRLGAVPRLNVGVDVNAGSVPVMFTDFKSVTIAEGSTTGVLAVAKA